MYQHVKVLTIRCGVEASHGNCVIERSTFLGGFDCHCVNCDDGEYDSDGVCRATNRIGHGKTPFEAAEDYADEFGGLDELI